ncbi:uncharacterized protein LOC143905150 [Temnothorax americanus]|uniref:uncharacterized protein LOC143905150 n=1 Tax=Temnothorax americanus TaxID=1964332 RepID=UPI0040687B0A
MLSRVTVNIIRRSVYSNARTLCYSRDPLRFDLSLHKDARPRSVQNHCNLYVAKRFKSSRKKAADKKKDRDDDSDEEGEEDDEEKAPVGSKVAKVKVSSLRVDTICKVGFGMTRSKVEEAFYASKFRINGNKVFKKSKEVDVGDEIDIVLHQCVDNPELLVVNRIVILSIAPAADGVQIKLSKDKNLLIEDYEDPYLT